MEPLHLLRLRAERQDADLLIIPAAKHLFDNNENFGAGVPTGEVAGDKLRDEYLPTFSRCFPEQMPDRGAGSRNGKKFDAITFKNGRTLKFLSGSGGSQKRAGITLRAVGVTEADKVDIPPIKSTDPNPIGEIEGRLASHGDDSAFYAECTITTKKGFVYREWLAGSRGEFMKPCPHCRTTVCPGKEHFVGWEAALDETTAREGGTFICPSCSEILSEDDRRWMNVRTKLVHRGQESYYDAEADVVVVTGDRPKTKTCGIRWSAFDNAFWNYSFIGAKCWRAANPTDESDEESNEKWVAQYMFAEPWEEDVFDLMPLTIEDLRKRILPDLILPGSAAPIPLGVGRVPPNTVALSCGMDCRQTQLHYVVRAWMEENGVVRSSAIDVGTMDVHWRELGLREALIEAMIRFRDGKILPGYFDSQGNQYAVGWTLVDAGWKERFVWEFMLDCAEKGINGFAPIFGRGQSQPPGIGSYRHPDEVAGSVLWIGEECHIRRSSKYAGMFTDAGTSVEPFYIIGNSDEWKSFARYGYMTPPDRNGALFTFTPTSAEEHRILNEFRKQTKAETKQRRVVEGRGAVDVFVNTSRRPNHLGDCDYYACIGGHLCGVRVVIKHRDRQVTVPAELLSAVPMPDGRSFTAPI